MFRSLAMVCVVCLLVVGCHQRIAPQNPLTSENTTTDNPAGPAAELAAGDVVIGEPLQFANLTIFPVSSKEPRNDDRFITLDEGLKTGSVEILEMGAEQSDEPPANPATNDAPSQDAQEDLFAAGESRSAGNEVNRLMVANRSDKRLYLMPGEVIVGGSQDRTIGQELVIQPDGKPVPIAVFCVEHGRWGERGSEQTVEYLNAAVGSAALNDSVAFNEEDGVEQAARAADQGKFVATVGSLSKAARVAVQHLQSQGEVWDKVAAENAKSGVQLEPGTFSGNYVESDSVARLNPYLEKLQTPVADLPQVVGVVVAVNGKVESMDVFGSTPLFKKLWPKLLKSYALDAANAAPQENAAVTCPRAAACQFYEEAVAANVEQSEVEGGLVVTKRSSDSALIFSAADSAESMGGCGGFGGVHAAAFAH